MLVVGPTTAEELLEADAVVLATPAAPAARLLADVAPTRPPPSWPAIESASVAVVTLAFRAADVADANSADRSGFLVPPSEGRRIKASTFSFAKWGWVRSAGRGDRGGDDVVHLRTSLGRHREETALQASDEELVAVVAGRPG